MACLMYIPVHHAHVCSLHSQGGAGGHGSCLGYGLGDHTLHLTVPQVMYRPSGNTDSNITKTNGGYRPCRTLNTFASPA